MFRDEDELATTVVDSGSEDEYIKHPEDSVLQMLPPKSRDKNAKVFFWLRLSELCVIGSDFS